MRWAGHVEYMGERSAYMVSVEKPEGKRQLGRPMRRRDDNIKNDLRKVGWVICAGLMWLRVRTGGRHLSMR